MRHPNLFQNLCRLTSVIFLGLVCSGVFLFFAYRPDAAAAWGDLYEVEGAVTLSSTAQTLHRIAGILLILLLVLTVAIGLSRYSQTRAQSPSQRQGQGRGQAKGRINSQSPTHSDPPIAPTSVTGLPPTTVGGRVVMVTIPAFALIALISGFLLPWDQLALYAVTVGTNMQGYQPVFSDDVRFVLANGHVVSKETLAGTLVVHAAAATVVGGWLLSCWPRRGPRKSVTSESLISESGEGQNHSPDSVDVQVIDA